MNDRHDFETLLTEGVQVPPASAALQDRVAKAVIARLAAGAPRRAPRRRWVWAWAAAVTCLIALVVWRPAPDGGSLLTPALQLSRMASAAERVPLAHYRSYRPEVAGGTKLFSEFWAQPPYYRLVKYLGEERRVQGFDGEAYWSYDTVRRAVTIAPNTQSLPFDGFTITAVLERLQQGAGDHSATVTTAVGQDGRPVRMLTYEWAGHERMILHADPATDLPFRIEVFTQPRNAYGRPEKGATWTLREWREVAYPKPLPPAFFQVDAPADYRRIELGAAPPRPTSEAVRDSLAREPIATLQGPEDCEVAILDVALCGDLAYVAYAVDPSKAGLGLGFVQLSGYLTAYSFRPRDRSEKDRQSVLPEGLKIGGALCCTPDQDSAPPRPASLNTIVFLGRKALQTSAIIPPERVRTVPEPPAWWLALNQDPRMPVADWARAKYWLEKDSHKAVHYAEAVVSATQGGEVFTGNLEYCKLLGDARHADGDDAGALAAYDSGLALLPAMEPHVREHWRRELGKAKGAITGQPVPGPTYWGPAYDARNPSARTPAPPDAN